MALVNGSHRSSGEGDAWELKNWEQQITKDNLNLPAKKSNVVGALRK